MSTRDVARPVLKWAGGKTQLLESILQRLPQTIATYREPFLGGGAVFFALAVAGRFQRAVLSDRNPELVGVYRAIQQDVDGLIARLTKFVSNEEEFYRVRATAPRSLVGRAARTIYLNKTGYNGLYRVNRSGGFNVPFGRYAKPKICDELNLRRVHAVLDGVELVVDDFENQCRLAQAGDAVYLDPPYMPLSKTAHFTSYDRHSFGLPEHQRLGDTFRQLAERGVCAVLSNSDTPETRQLYAGFDLEFPQVTRSINSKGSARGPVSEILVSNVPSRRRSKRAVSAK